MLLKKLHQSENAVNMLNLGRMAEAVWPEFSHLITSRRELALNSLKYLYKEKKTDCALYIAEAAIITCLDEIVATVDRSIRLSHEKEKELLNGSPTNPGQR